MDIDWLKEAYQRTRKVGAVGVDGQNGKGCGENLEENLQSLLDRAKLREMLDRRMRDGVLRRLIGKWLKAGVLEKGCLTYPETGSPQGGVISPLLANIYLHEVLDVWFEQEVRPRLPGRAFLVRYADDFVMGFALEEDARRVMEVLPKRFERWRGWLNRRSQRARMTWERMARLLERYPLAPATAYASHLRPQRP